MVSSPLPPVPHRVCVLQCTFIDDVVTGPEFPREPSIFMSLVVPAYNENERRPIMLDETIEYFKVRLRRREQTAPSSRRVRGLPPPSVAALDLPQLAASHYPPAFPQGRPNASKEVVEIIVVDDGSKDDTAKIASQYGAKLNAKFKASSGGGIVLRVLKVSPNCGKGNAVKQGMLRARGELCLMVDADGASRISDLVLLEKGIKDCTTDDGHGISVGSRAHLADAAIAQRSFIRNILMHGFHALGAGWLLLLLLLLLRQVLISFVFLTLPLPNISLDAHRPWNQGHAVRLQAVHFQHEEASFQAPAD